MVPLHENHLVFTSTAQFSKRVPETINTNTPSPELQPRVKMFPSSAEREISFSIRTGWASGRGVADASLSKAPRGFDCKL